MVAVMVWTYDVSDLQTNAKDQVRFIVGDTVPSDPQMQDEEINFAITQRSSIYGAAALCCRALQAKFSRSVDKAAGDTKMFFSQMAKAYGRKVAELEALAASTGSAGMPFVGGISVADMIQRQGNSDRIPPVFNIGMMDALLPVPPVGPEQQESSETDLGAGPGGL